MRLLIATLVEHFGANYTQDFNVFVNEQYCRFSEAGGKEFTLGIANENTIIEQVKQCITEFGLSAEDVLNYVMLAPFVDKAYNVSCIIEFKSEAYIKMMEQVADIKVQLFTSDDKITFKGEGVHVKYKQSNQNKVGPIIGGFINGKYKKTNKHFSVYIDGEDFAGSVEYHEKEKYNNITICDQDWWKHVKHNILFRRLLDKFAGALLFEEDVFSAEKYNAMINYGLSNDNESESATKIIYSDFGRKIGHTIKPWTEADVIEYKKGLLDHATKPRTLALAVDNTKNEVNQNYDNDEEVFTEWGQF